MYYVYPLHNAFYIQEYSSDVRAFSRQKTSFIRNALNINSLEAAMLQPIGVFWRARVCLCPAPNQHQSGWSFVPLTSAAEKRFSEEKFNSAHPQTKSGAVIW
jgi:hypothetical protein